MAPINSRPFLEYLLSYISEYGISKAILSVGYLHETIEKHFGNIHNNISLNYVVENSPLGTGGAILLSLENIKSENVLVLNGDSIYKVDINILLDFHIKNKADVTLSLRNINDTGRYGKVMLDDKNNVTEFLEKQENSGGGLINTGVYIINKNIFENTGLSGKFSFEKDFLEKEITKKKIIGFVSNDFFLDIGIPEDYAKAHDEFKRNNIEWEMDAFSW